MTEAHYTPPSRPAPKRARRPASSKPKRMPVAKQRQLVETAIARLMQLLDEATLDPDFEPECEDEGAQCEDEGAEHDGSEPSLGSLDTMVDQTRWAAGDNSMVDVELDESDKEASLGWQNEGSQARLHTSPGDREQECEDEGAEHDGREPFGVNIHGGGGLSGL